jgi:hypothetical protein
MSRQELAETLVVRAFLVVDLLSMLAGRRTCMRDLRSASVSQEEGNGGAMPKFMEGYATRLRVPAGARDVLSLPRR